MTEQPTTIITEEFAEDVTDADALGFSGLGAMPRLASRPFAASYDGDCCHPSCPIGTFEAGDEIAYDDENSLMHRDCFELPL